MADAEQWTFKEQPSSPMPFDRIEKLRDRQKLLDFKIIANDGHEVAANRFLLATRFPRIADTVTADEQARMEWRRFSANIVEAAVTFAYTGRVEITMRNVASLFLLSTNLGCSTLTSGCIEFLRPRLSEDNVEIFWSIANATMNADLISICVPAIAANFDAFTARPKFYSSTEAEYLASVLRDNRLTHVTEESKMRVVAKWFASAKTTDDKKYPVDCFKDLVESVDLTQMSTEVWAKLCASDLMLSLPELCRQHIVDSWLTARKSGRLCSGRTFRDYVLACQLPDYQSNSLYFRNLLSEATYEILDSQLQSRQECAVTSFNENIYIIGGKEWINDRWKTTNKVDRLDHFTGSFSTVPPMKWSRSSPCAVAGDNHVFVFGGRRNGETFYENEKFDPNQNRWTLLPDMVMKRSETSAVNVPDMGIVVVGGTQSWINRNVNFVELLAPSTADGDDWSWRELTLMLHSRRRPAVAYFRGCVIVAGGNAGPNITVECLRIAPKYPEPVQWTQLAAPEQNTSTSLSLAAFNGRLILGCWSRRNSTAGSLPRASYSEQVLEFLRKSESDDPELEEFEWKPIHDTTLDNSGCLLVIRKRL